jgi:hypothetical protein
MQVGVIELVDRNVLSFRRRHVRTLCGTQGVTLRTRASLDVVHDLMSSAVVALVVRLVVALGGITADLDDV